MIHFPTQQCFETDMTKKFMIYVSDAFVDFGIPEKSHFAAN